MYITDNIRRDCQTKRLQRHFLTQTRRYNPFHTCFQITVTSPQVRGLNGTTDSIQFILILPGNWSKICQLVLIRGKTSFSNVYDRRQFCISSVQFSHSFVSDSLQPHGLQHARPPCPSLTPGVYPNSCLIDSVIPSNHLSLCHPFLLPPSIVPSIRVFSNESVLCIRWPKYWNFSFNISPSNEHSELIFFKVDWLEIQSVLHSQVLKVLHKLEDKGTIFLDVCISKKWILGS